MRSRWLLGAAIVLGVASLGSADDQFDRDSEVGACIAACDAARVACETDAKADVDRCEKDAYAPCKAWCPCTQFIGAAHFACLMECEICETEAATIAARCPDGSEARSTCAAAQRRCVEDCE